MHEIRMHDYWNENTSNDTFYFSVSVVELEFQPIGFLASHFFITFIRKWTQEPILTLCSRILGDLTEKRRTQFFEHRLSIVKIRRSIILIANAQNVRYSYFYNGKLPSVLRFSVKPTNIRENRVKRSMCVHFRIKVMKKWHMRKSIDWNWSSKILSEKWKMSLDVFSFQ